MESQPLVLQRRIVGVLIRAAREKARRTVSEVAQRLGVSAARVRDYERGGRDVSLPELELLALFFEAPVSHLMKGETPTEEQFPRLPGPEGMRARRVQIAKLLKQARLSAGKSKDECAQVIGRKPSTLGRYERGLADIPLGELDKLARFLNLSLFHFVEKSGDGGDTGDVMDLEKLARLPKEVRAFALEPANLPFLRMAMKFAHLPADQLKELAEVLSVVR